MKKKILILILIFAFLCIGAGKNDRNKDYARGRAHLEKKEPVIECYPDGCCYEMNTRTIWSCET